MPADTRLVDIASSLLANLADGLDAEGVAVPSRQYIHSGEVAYDFDGDNCAEQLVVTFTGILQGPGSSTGYIPGSIIKCAVPLIAQFDVHLVRCVPNINDESIEAPTAQELTDAAVVLLHDSMTLPAVAISKELAGELTEQRCSLKGIGNVAPIGPAGAAGGTVLSIFVELV